jgi:FkbM family methyltransferase
MSDVPNDAVSDAPIASVVIPAHNASSVIGDQLEALVNQVDAPNFEVVVALNMCTDDTEEVVRSFKNQLQLSIVRADGQASAAHARNAGAAASKTDVLLFCDADDRVGPNWVNAMTNAVGELGADFVGGPVVIDRDGLPDWAYHEFYGVDGIYLKPSPNGFERPLGGNLGVTRAAFEQVEGFDESFPGSCEDSDLTLRLTQAGFRVDADLRAVVTVRPRTTTRSLIRRKRIHAPGGPYLLAKHHRLPHPPAYFDEYRATLRWLAHLIVRRRTWRPDELYARFVIRRADELALRRAWNTATSNAPAVAPDAAIHECDFIVAPETPVIGGLGFRADAAWAQPWVTRGVPRMTLGLAGSLLQDGDVVVDVGAGIGLFSVAAAKLVGPRGKVISFESDHAMRTFLVKNLARHGTDGTTEVRMSRVSGPFRPTAPPDQAVETLLPPMAAATQKVISADPVLANTDAVALDDCVSVPVQLIRVSAHGHEASVLSGAKSLLERSPDVALLLDLSPRRLAETDSSVAALLELLPPRGWSIWMLHDSRPEPLYERVDDEVDSRIDALPADWRGHLLMLPPHRAEEI